MIVYVQSVSAKKEGDAKEKMLPIDGLAQAMITHGEEFEPDSLFGNCLTSAFLSLSAILAIAALTNVKNRNGTGQREDCQSTGCVCCLGQ